MFEKMSCERFCELAQNHSRLVVYQEIPGDELTPINVTQALRPYVKGISLLESNPKQITHGRYSTLCFDPIAQVQSEGQKLRLTTAAGAQEHTAEPLAFIRDLQKQYYAKTDHKLSGYVGGMVGFVGYDAIRLQEAIPDRHQQDNAIPDLFFRFYQHNIAFDHQTGKVVVSTLVEVGDDTTAAYQSGMNTIAKLIHLLHQQSARVPTSLGNTLEGCFEPDIEDEQFMALVEKAKQHIIKGDVFQVVLSRNFCLETDADPFDIYRALRFSNPSPYMFYLEADGFVVAGASPEKLISIKDGLIESCPLAGTRARRSGKDDKQLAEALLQDEKEVAEHMMLVDLSRNDVGALSLPGTVSVKKLKEVEIFSRVMHISSTVQGQLRPELDALTALVKAFPAGTLTGAPKIRAMELIDAFETSRRGLYGGAICAIDSEDNLESCIAIRMAVIQNGLAVVRAGCGVVFDSKPQAEADETRHKAQAILEGITMAQGELA